MTSSPLDTFTTALDARDAGTPEITVRLPPMYFPTPPRLHPDVRLLEERALAWMNEHGFLRDPALRRRVIDTKSAYFIGYLCPRAPTERLQLAVDWVYLMFVFDDVQDVETHGDDFGLVDMATRIIRSIEAPGAGVLHPAQPFTSAVLDLTRRLHRIATPAQVYRLAAAHYAWLMAVAWEISAKARVAIPTLNDYLLIRPRCAAADPTIAWFEIAEPGPVPEADITRRDVRALTEMSGAVAALDNDLHSYGRDLWLFRHRSAAVQNIVRVYRDGQDLTEEHALRSAAALRDRIVARFCRVREEVVPAASPPLARYVDNLASLIRGNHEWGMHSTRRYSNPDGRHPGAVHTTGTVTDTPAVTGPPGIPTIDWWWRG